MGSNSATPAYGRFPTSHYLNVNDHAFLIDCGEGAQVRLAQYKLSRNKISHIFISHMHGDHIFGLPGLITSMNLNSWKDKLTIFGPIGIKLFLTTVLKVSYSMMNFELEIVELDNSDKSLILDLEDVEVFKFPVYHRVPTNGFLISQKKQPRNIKKEVIKKYNLSIEQIKEIKAGRDMVIDNQKIKNEALTLNAVGPCSYAYCADSIADERIIDDVKGATGMYFETTYLNELADKAKERGHATAGEAARMAELAKVNVLITGHYSSRYKKVDDILHEAKMVFPNTILGYDGVMLDIQSYL